MHVRLEVEQSLFYRRQILLRENRLECSNTSNLIFGQLAATSACRLNFVWIDPELLTVWHLAENGPWWRSYAGRVRNPAVLHFLISVTVGRERHYDAAR